MSGGGIDGVAVGAVAAGALFMYAGVKGLSVLKTVQALTRGQAPAAGQQTAQQTSTGSGGGAAAYNSASSLQKLWTDNGGPENTAAFAAAVARAESGGSATITSSNPDGGTNVGIFQLDTPGGVGAGYTIAQLQNPNLNTQITVMATSGGTNWSEWDDPVTNAVGRHYSPGAPVPA